MRLVTRFDAARALLGVPLDGDAGAIKRAYRRALREHPPDLDPEGFRNVREAYELLTDVERATALLADPLPLIAPPAAPSVPAAPRGSAAIAALRWAATMIDAARLDPPRPPRAPKEQR